MRQVRRGLFETNSSSTHSLTVCSKDEYQRWKDGKLLFDRWNDKFVDASSVESKYDIDMVKEMYERVKNKRWKNFEDLTPGEVDDFCNEYLDRDDDDRQFVTCEQYFDYYGEMFDTYKREYTSEHGDNIVMFGYYGHD